MQLPIDFKKYSSYFLFALLCLFVLGSTFVSTYPFYDNYFTVIDLSKALPVLAAGVCLFLRIHPVFRFRPGWSDLFFVLLVAYAVFRYDREARLADWKIINLGQLLIIWFSVRMLLSRFPGFRRVVLIALVVSGCVQAGWGLLQLYGYLPSNHTLFAITGSFGNPGPFSGYIATVVPVCLYLTIIGKRAGHYLALAALALMFCVIPAGMSRSAWVGAAVACLWMTAVEKDWKKVVLDYYRLHRKKVVAYAIAGIVLGTSCAVFLFIIKKDSAHGRLFIWENTLAAIADRPLAGYGPGAFPAAYGEKQAACFSAGSYTALEERVAGSPEYAFNEYLEMATEGGIILLFLFLGWIGTAFRQGVRNKAYGACAGVLSLGIFALAAYPFQLIPLRVAGVLLLAVCASAGVPRKEEAKMNPRSFLFYGMRWAGAGLSIGLLAASLWLYLRLKPDAELAGSWNKCRLLNTTGAVKAAARGYAGIYEPLRHNPVFLFEYAQCLNAGKNYDEAVPILRRAARVSCDPMIYNVMGENYQQLHRYEEAEACYRQALRLLPGRLYPYYRLARLYAEPEFRQEEKMREAARTVLTKPPKIWSKAVEEMREEMEKLLQAAEGWPGENSPGTDVVERSAGVIPEPGKTVSSGTVSPGERNARQRN